MNHAGYLAHGRGQAHCRKQVSTMGEHPQRRSRDRRSGCRLLQPLVCNQPLEHHLQFVAECVASEGRPPQRQLVGKPSSSLTNSRHFPAKPSSLPTPNVRDTQFVRLRAQPTVAPGRAGQFTDKLAGVVLIEGNLGNRFAFDGSHFLDNPLQAIDDIFNHL